MPIDMYTETKYVSTVHMHLLLQVTEAAVMRTKGQAAKLAALMVKCQLRQTRKVQSRIVMHLSSVLQKAETFEFDSPCCSCTLCDCAVANNRCSEFFRCSASHGSCAFCRGRRHCNAFYPNISSAVSILKNWLQLLTLAAEHQGFWYLS